MKTRRFLALLLAFSLLIFPGCKEGGNRAGLFQKKDVLTVCVDTLQNIDLERDMYDFMYTFKQVTGIEEVRFEYLPKPGVERETAIQRIRTELMSGSGPDVFLTHCTTAENALFPYPEKVMEAGFFLPLDEYMENNTKYTEWDKQHPVVLAAGRNEEGQQIIPLSYSCPVHVYDKAVLDIEKPDHMLTFAEILSDPELNSIYSKFYNCHTLIMNDGETFSSIWPGLFGYILGKWIDFENEELLFTEEELLSTVETIFSLPLDESIDGTEYIETDDLASLPQLVQPFTILPLYNADGGVTVTVSGIAAINRNTKHPEEAYEFLDFFMREKTQLASYVYAAFSFAAVPIYDQAYKEGYPFFHKTLTDEGYAEFAEFKEQITSVNFNNDLVKDLALMITDCWNANKEGLPYEEIVHNAYEQMQRKIKE